MSKRTLAIVAFLVIDVALGAAAWMHAHRPPADSDIDASLSASSEPSVGAPNQIFSLASENVVMVAAGPSGVIVTARRGSCDGVPPVVRVSTDGGKSLIDADPTLSEVLAVDVDGDGVITVAGADANCRIGAMRSTDNGRSWDDASPDSAGGWFASAGDLSTLVTPEGESKPGCDVSSMSAIDDTFARVSCTDGRLRGTGDAGETWTTLGRLANLRTAAFDDYSTGTALARYEGCADYAFATEDGGRTWDAKGCIGGDSAQGLTSDGNRLIAVVDEQIAVSTNGGTTWTIHEQTTPSPEPSSSDGTASPTASPTPSPSATG